MLKEIITRIQSVIDRNDVKYPNKNSSAMSLGNDDGAPHDNERIVAED